MLTSRAIGDIHKDQIAKEIKKNDYFGIILSIGINCYHLNHEILDCV